MGPHCKSDLRRDPGGQRSPSFPERPQFFNVVDDEWRPGKPPAVAPATTTEFAESLLAQVWVLPAVARRLAEVATGKTGQRTAVVSLPLLACYRWTRVSVAPSFIGIFGTFPPTRLVTVVLFSRSPPSKRRRPECDLGGRAVPLCRIMSTVC